MVIPAPVSRVDGDGTFDIGGVGVRGSSAVAAYLRERLGLPEGDGIELVLGDGVRGGYLLEASAAGIRIEAADAGGLFAGAQTLLQLAPRVPFTRIEDHPRFAYRGAMLDVARHFFPVAAVKRYIDDIALLKINHLHLHLTDDQGWRIEIRSWPELTGIGAVTQVDGGGGGYYTQEQYSEIVEYAASRFITIVPEIDLPGHTNAAISAYPELGDAPAEPYEGIEVGFSSLAIRSEATYSFVEDVVREVAALTPGPYLHLGGDESLSTTDEDFLHFIARATAIAAKHGKTLIGWHEMGRSPELPAGTIGQYWSFIEPQEGAAEHTSTFAEVIMSPADVSYLDIKYDDDTELGLVWANGPTTLEQSYQWDPDDIIPGLAVLGVEAATWTETISTIEQLEWMAFPRIAAIAEIAWSPREGRSFAGFASRLPAFGAVLDAAGIRFNRVPGIDWREPPSKSS